MQVRRPRLLMIPLIVMMATIFTAGISAQEASAVTTYTSSVATTATPAVALPAYGPSVACMEKVVYRVGSNSFGMVLTVLRVDVYWCWDRNGIVTSGYQHPTEDTPGLCWGFDGWAGPYYGGGAGNYHWDISESARFHCTLAWLTSYKTLTANIEVSGYGGISTW